MIIKKINTVELHFNNYIECEEYKDLYKRKGYKIIKSGSEDDWYFVCQRVKI